MSKHICVVVAVHNRLHSVHMALHAWSLQTQKDFSLVLADDGSTEEIFGLVRAYEGNLRIQYYRQCDAEHGKVAVVLNKGTVLAPPETTHIWYTDGDIIFGRKAMEYAYGHIREYPDRVIAGRYDWMPPMKLTPDILEHDFQKFVNCELALQEIGITGERTRRPDHRLRRHRKDWFEHKLLDECRAVLGANTIIPTQAWYEIGGWDEHIPGGNANDCDFGWCLTDEGYHLLTCDCIIGYHQWHSRNPAALHFNARTSLPYIFRKHGEEVPDEWKPYDTFAKEGGKCLKLSMMESK